MSMMLVVERISASPVVAAAAPRALLVVVGCFAS
jgi:hypothetical protein